jgi:thiamine biosynthesis lipoprotein
MFSTPGAPPDHPRRMQSRRRLAMGTFATVEANLLEGPALGAIEAAFCVIASVEEKMHPTRPGSDLARINGESGNSFEIAPSTWEVLSLAQQIATASGGLFDPCPPDSEGGIADVELGSAFLVRCRKRLLIDLGGIAKGYAVDAALRCLRKHGCESALVNIGGDIGAFGPAQTVGVRLREQIIRCELRNGAVAVSDTGSIDSPAEHRGYYSRIGQRKLRRNFVAVTAPSAAVADALTKCALYCKEDEWLALARKFGAARLA